MLGVASSRRDARIPARTHILARICAMKQSRTKSLATNIRTIPKNMPTNFQLKRLKLKLDIVEKPENRVHKLTDSNGAPRKSAICKPASRGRLYISLNFAHIRSYIRHIRSITDNLKFICLMVLVFMASRSAKNPK